MGPPTQTKPASQQTIAAVEELPPVQAVQIRKDNPQTSIPEEASKVIERLLFGWCSRLGDTWKCDSSFTCAILSIPTCQSSIYICEQISVVFILLLFDNFSKDLILCHKRYESLQFLTNLSKFDIIFNIQVLHIVMCIN